jgi:hypothetical protein
LEEKAKKSLRKLKAPESNKQSKISIPLQAIYRKLNEAYTITRIIYGQFTGSLREFMLKKGNTKRSSPPSGAKGNAHELAIN